MFCYTDSGRIPVIPTTLPFTLPPLLPPPRRPCYSREEVDERRVADGDLLDGGDAVGVTLHQTELRALLHLGLAAGLDGHDRVRSGQVGPDELGTAE